jgi:serine/threonine-protein kinase
MTDVATAVQELVQAGLAPLLYYSSSPTVAAGYVISAVMGPGQTSAGSPAAGLVVPVNSQVVVTVSTGVGGTVGSATVPNVVGLTPLAATAALAAAFVSCDKYLWAVSASVAQGLVLAQSIAGGTPVTPGTVVQLTLSAGAARVAQTVTVPNVTT